MAMTLEDAKLCVGSGWHALLEQAWQVLQQHGCEPVGCKEKYGGLRVEWYWNYEQLPLDDDLDYDSVITAIMALEDTSYHICECCGAAGEPHKVQGWWKTTCLTCTAKRKVAI